VYLAISRRDVWQRSSQPISVADVG
jgi:hypothetical protein